MTMILDDGTVQPDIVYSEEELSQMLFDDVDIAIQRIERWQRTAAQTEVPTSQEVLQVIQPLAKAVQTLLGEIEQWEALVEQKNFELNEPCSECEALREAGQKMSEEELYRYMEPGDVCSQAVEYETNEFEPTPRPGYFYVDGTINIGKLLEERKATQDTSNKETK